MKDWVKPGTHIACMGTDTKGKQEIDPELVAMATLFTDEIAQSVTIGETQHAVAGGLISEDDITAIGEAEPVNEMRHSPGEDYCTISSLG